MRLPPALQPWHDWLAWFSPEIATGLGALLMRLDPLLGLPSPARAHDGAEPDGIDDLHRRGSYERLLLSEWAMADAVPDEFLRRAAGGEHLFLAPRRRTPKADRALVALFDAGPAQLGAPRLAHIALWILLARRAARAGVRYTWGVLQEPGVLHDADSATRLSKLLRARTFAPATAEHRAEWAAALDTLGTSERWTIGATARTGNGVTHAAAVLHGFDDRLHVTIATPRGRRQLDVEPPAGDVARQLLHGEFLSPPAEPAASAAPSKFALQQAPLFSWQGNHVAVPMLDDSKAMIYRLPGAPGVTPYSRPTKWTARTPLYFAELDERHLCGAMHTAEHLRLWQMDVLRQAPTSADFRIAPGRPGWRWCTRFHKPAEGSTAFIACDDGGQLGQWTRAPGHTRPEAPLHFELIARHVIGATRTDWDHVLYARYVPSKLVIYRRHRDGSTALLADATMAWAPVRCLFVTLPTSWAIAVEAASPDGSRWFIDAFSNLPTPTLQPVELGDNAKVVGLLRTSNDGTDNNGTDVGLLTLDRQRRQLLVAGRDGPALYTARHPIAVASTSPDGAYVALVDHTRTLIVLDRYGATLLETQGHDRARR